MHEMIFVLDAQDWKEDFLNQTPTVVIKKNKKYLHVYILHEFSKHYPQKKRNHHY